MNAIILAAGLGSRFESMSQTHHKSLLPINGVPNLERTIQFLLEANIQDIYIVTGHLHEQFEFLEERYAQVNLIYNKQYSKYNSIYTFSLALPYFNDSIIIDADTVFKSNIFKEIPIQEQSLYYTIIRETTGIEWCPILNENERVSEIKITDEKRPSLSGVSYWTSKDCLYLKSIYPNYLQESFLLNTKLYWDNIVLNHVSKLNITTKLLQQKSLYEMDNQQDYAFIQKEFQLAQNK